MEKLVGDLLEDLDKVYPKSITIGELLKKRYSKDLIFNAAYSKFIKYPIQKRDYFHNAEINPHNFEVDDSIPLKISKRGFNTLNQIRIKKVITDLDKSINSFNGESSIQAKKMIDLTEWIRYLTIALLILAVVQVIMLIFFKCI